MTLPGYNFLPAPVWLITALHVLTLTLHFVAMNFLVGGLVVVLFGRFEGRWSHPVVRRFTSLFPVAMAATVTLGVAPLLFAQLVYHRQLYAASIVSGWLWLGILGAAVAAYYLLYSAAFAAPESRRAGVVLPLALLAFLYISFVYSSVFALTDRPELITRLYAAAPGGTSVNPQVLTWIFRWPHMLLGAVTVGSFFVGLLGRNDPAAFATARRFFLGGMVGTMILGLAFLLSELDFLRAFMRSPGIWFVGLALVLSLGSLHFFFKRRFLPAGLMVFLSLLGMVSARHVLRLVHLRGWVDPAAVPIRPQWSVFILFLVCFVAALAVVGWMLVLFFRGRPGDRAEPA